MKLVTIDFDKFNELRITKPAYELSWYLEQATIQPPDNISKAIQNHLGVNKQSADGLVEALKPYMGVAQPPEVT